MNETINNEVQETVQQPESVPETAPETDPDNWDDMDFSDVRDDAAPAPEPASEPEPEADHSDQPQQEQTEDKPEESAPETQQEEQELFELKHYDGVRKVDRNSVVALAQMGLDYENIRAERDSSRAQYAELEGFLREITPPGMTIQDLMDQTRANVLADREGIDQSIALQRVQLERDRKAFEAQQRQQEAAKQVQSQEDQRINGSFVRFIEQYPDVDPKTIPQEVWDEFGRGADLAGCYARWENKQLKQQLQEAQAKAQVQEQNTKNKERSTGSQQSAGAGDAQKPDAIDLDWYGDD